MRASRTTVAQVFLPLRCPGRRKAVEMAARLREMCPESRAGVVVEDGEVQQVIIATDDDQAKLLGLA